MALRNLRVWAQPADEANATQSISCLTKNTLVARDRFKLAWNLDINDSQLHFELAWKDRISCLLISSFKELKHLKKKKKKSKMEFVNFQTCNTMLHPNQLRQVSPAHRAVDGSEPDPCCLGAAVHTVIWLLTSSTFCQTALTAILFTRAPTYQGKLFSRCWWQN